LLFGSLDGGMTTMADTSIATVREAERCRGASQPFRRSSKQSLND
jgi:hypothetical protein